MVASSYIHDKHDCWIRFVMEWFWTLATRNVAKSSYCETFVLPGRYVEYIYTKLTAHASWKIKLEKIMSQAKQLYLPPYMLMLRLPSLLSTIALKHSNWLCTHVHIYCWWMITPLCGHILLVSYYTTELWALVNHSGLPRNDHSSVNVPVGTVFIECTVVASWT